MRQSTFVLALALLAQTAGAQAAAPAAAAARVSAPITGVSYTLTMNRMTGARHVLDVTMSFTSVGATPVLLSLPAWTPGAYEISNFAKGVTSFTPTSGGKPLVWDKIDYDTWQIRTGGAKPVEVRFTYISDSLDTAKTWVQPDFALINGTTVFLYPEGRPAQFSAAVSIVTEPGWKVATGMKRNATGTYGATNYHDLVDMPFFVGAFDVDSAEISGKWTRFATYPAGSISGATRAEAWTQLKKVIPPQVAIFGSAPWDTYTVMQIVDSTFAGASGLEHQNSHVDILSPPFVGSDFQPSLYAHEVFHAWNVKRLRPSELWPYVYDRARPTTLLWMSEGITDYYADIALVRGGVLNDSGFFATTAGKINEVASAPPTALEDASLSTWVHPSDGTGYIYYPKGSLVGFILDIMIRDASDNASSLDAVMKALYQGTYAVGRGFTAADFWREASKAAKGKSFADVNAKYIDGREPFAWDQILPLAGLKAVQARVPRLGVFTQGDATGVVITQVDPTGAAASAGVQAGDILLSVGDIPVEDALFGEKFRAKYATAAEGSPLAIRIRRAGQERTMQAQLRFAPGQVELQIDPNASAKAVRIRNGILGR
jgi:predicted metalloprotease with PDZ domain